MSYNESSSGPGGQETILEFNLPTAEQSQAMDNTIERFRDLTPSKPYIMTVFSDPPYQHTHRTRHGWLANTPFDRDEDDNMQYQTLLWRDPLETLFCLESTENMEARRVGTSQMSSAPGSRAGTPLPSSGVAKKKISLAAYKNKKQTGTSAGSHSALDSHEGGSQGGSRPTPDVKADDQSDAAPSPALLGKKRSAELDVKKESGHDSIDFSLDPMDDITPSPKKRRLSNSMKDEAKVTKTAAVSETKPSTNHGLDLQALKDHGKNTPPPSVTISKSTDQISQSDPMFLSVSSSVDPSQPSYPGDHLPGWFAPKRDSSLNSLINKSFEGSVYNVNGILPLSGKSYRAEEKVKRHSSSDSKSTLNPLPFPSGDVVKANSVKPNGLDSTALEAPSDHIKNAKKSDPNAKTPVQSLELNDVPKISESTSHENGPSTPSHSQAASKRLPQAQSSSTTEKPTSSTPNASRPALKHVKNKTSSSFFDNLKSSSISASSKAIASSGNTAKHSSILKLKYGRQRRKQVERILHMKAVPKDQIVSSSTTRSDTDQDREPPQTGTNASLKKTEINKMDKENPKKGEKRSYTDDGTVDEPLVKRARGSTLGDNKSPRTPHMANVKSPIVLTPASTHTKDAKTGLLTAPYVMSKATSPPTSIKTSPGADESISPESWKSENSRLRILGRSVKKSSTEIFETAEKEKGNEKSAGLQKQAAVLGLESVLCFVQAFSASDEYTSRKESLSHWKSMLPYASQVSSRCKEYPHLYGMSTILRTAVSSKILAVYARMKSKDLEDLEGNSDPFTLVSHEIEASRQLAVASERHLPRSVMATEYPRTHVEANKIPIGMITKPILAARMCSVFLDEWTTRQKIDWTKQLEEGLCSHL